MNVNHLKENLRKVKPLYGKKNLGEKLLTDLKENDPLYVDGSGLNDDQHPYGE